MSLHAARYHGELTTYERSVGAVVADSGDDLVVGDELVLLGGVHRIDRIEPADSQGWRTAWCHGRPYARLIPRQPYKVLPRVKAATL